MDKEVPEDIKHLFKEWTDYNLQKYGPNWKEIVAKQMSAQLLANPTMHQIIRNPK